MGQDCSSCSCSKDEQEVSNLNNVVNYFFYFILIPNISKDALNNQPLSRDGYNVWFVLF